MANKILNTRVQLRYDSYTNWEAHKTSVPLKGEMCICTAGTVNPNVDDVLLKVGDGTTTWELLPWVSAKAADVHEWAKKSWDEIKVEIETIVKASIKAGAELDESIIDGNKVIAHEEKLGTTYTSANDVSSIKSGETKTIKIPKVTVNKYGHITAAVDEEIEISIPNPGDSDTVRAVKVNGSEKLSSTKKDAVDYVDGTNTNVVWDASKNSIKIDAIDTTYDLGASNNKIVLTGDSDDDYVELKNTDKKLVIDTTDGHTITIEHATVDTDTDNNPAITVDPTTRTFTAIGSITVDNTGHVEAANPTTFTLPGYNVDAGNQIDVATSTSGSTTTYIVAHEAITRSDSETAKPAALSHSGKFVAVTGVVADNGHITDVKTTEFTLPGAATGGAAATNDTTIVSGAVLQDDVLTVTKKTIVGDDDVIDVTYANNEIKVSADLKEYTKTSNLGNAAVTSVKATGDDEITMTPKDAVKGSVEVTATHTKHAFEPKDLGTITISQESLKGSVVIPTLTVNEYGHVTAIENKTLDITLPNVTGAMHFLGTTSTEITDGGSQSPITIGDGSKIPVAGDVVIYNDLEYVFNDSGKWEVLGDEGSYALKTISIIGGEGLTGSSTLEKDVTISHAGPGAVSKTHTKETDRTYVNSIGTDKFGHIVSVEFGTETVTEKKGFALIQGDNGTTAGADSSEDTLKLYGDTYITTAAAESDPDEIQIKHNELHDSVGSAGPAAGGTLAYSGTFVVPALSYDKAGHITGVEGRTFTLPEAVVDTNTVTTIVEDTAKSGVAGGLYIKDNHNVADDTHTYTIQHSTYSTGSNTSTGSVTDKGTFEVIDSITTDNGHVTSVNTKTITVNETPAFAKVTPANSTATTAISTNTTSVTADTTSDELTIASGNRWVQLAGDATNDKITIAHAVGTAGEDQAPSLSNNTLTVYATQWDAAGHATGSTAKTVDLSSLIPTKDNDTTGKNIVGASASAKENAAVTGTSTNGVTVKGTTQKIYSADGVHLNHVETLDGTSTVVSSHKISGDGFIAVKSDASGNITVGVEQTGTDTLILVCGGADL